jgi:putative DNA primase/helicase
MNTEIKVLQYLNDEGLSTPSDIQKALKLSESQLDLILFQLEGKGYISNGEEVKLTDLGLGVIDGIKQKNKKEGLTKGICANLLMDKYRFICLDDTQELLVYQNGIYVPAESTVYEEVLEYFGDEEISKHTANEVLFILQASNYRSRKDLDSNPDIINLKNGLLNIKTGKLKEHTPRFLSLTQLPLTFDPTAECPRFLKFLSEVVDESDIPIIQELFGYCLYKNHQIHKAFMLVGDGANGKSTLLRILKIFLGPENVASVPLQMLDENRFATSLLYGKLANIYADLPARKILGSGNFKMLTGQDLIHAERKYQQPFNFVNYSKQVFSANQVPPVNEQTDAFFRRWIIINFPNKFEGEDADKKIVEKITTPEELSGILNWALEGLKRLLENGKFSDGLTTDQIREEYVRKSDPVGAFVMDCLKIDPEGEVLKDDLYSAYVEYCRQTKLPPVSKMIFSRDHLPKHVKDLREVRRGPKGARKRAWRGVRFKRTEEIEEEGCAEKCTCPRCICGTLDTEKTGTQKTLDVQGVQGNNNPMISTYSQYLRTVLGQRQTNSFPAL